jgi:hypothetical protein
MRQLLPKVGFHAGYGAPQPSYLGVLNGEGDWSNSVTYGADWAKVPLGQDSVFRRLVVAGPVVFAADVTVTLMVDGAASALAVTLPSGQFSARADGPDVSVLAGQDVSYRYEGPTLPAYGQMLACGLEREGAAMLFGLTPGSGSVAVGHGWIGGAFGNGVFETYDPASPPPASSTYALCAVPGAVTGLCLRAYSGAPGAGAWTAWVRKNGVRQDGTGGTPDTTTVLTGAATVVQSTCSVPGTLLDQFDVLLVRGGADAPFAVAHVAVGVVYTPSADGAFMCCGGSNDAVPGDTPSWKWTRSDQAADAPLESAHLAPIGSGGCETTGLVIERSLASGAGRAVGYTLRRNGTDTPLTTTIADLATTGSVTATQAYAEGDTITLQVAPGASGFAGQLHWGVAAQLLTVPPGQIQRIRRLRRAPHLSAEQVEQFFARFQLQLEAGVGTASDPGTDPQLSLRWSDDGGHTWRAPLAVSAGLQGAFRRRAIWRRLGRSRDRVFEVSMTDPVKWVLLAASLDATKGSS